MWRTIVLLLTLCCTVCLDSYAVQSPNKLPWTTNFDEAVAQARNEKKMLLLFFTGSDWCGWCHKLESEVLSTTEFADLVGNQFIFVLCDFPLKTPLDPSLVAQNKELQRKYDVKGFPTIVLLDDQQQLIGTTGYRAGGAKAYADYLLKMVENFKSYRKQVSLDAVKMNSDGLQNLYKKAQELQRKEDAQQIITIGLNSSDNRFFLLEQYRHLAKIGQMHSREAQGIKQELLSKDPNNLHMTHYDVAVIEFEALPEEQEKETYAPEITAAPIVSYIDRFGENDSENVWRLNMILAQVFLDKNKMQEALKYAKASHATAPQGVQSDILVFIRNIQETMSPITAKK